MVNSVFNLSINEVFSLSITILLLVIFILFIIFSAVNTFKELLKDTNEDNKYSNILSNQDENYKLINKNLNYDKNASNNSLSDNFNIKSKSTYKNINTTLNYKLFVLSKLSINYLLMYILVNKSIILSFLINFTSIDNKHLNSIQSNKLYFNTIDYLFTINNNSLLLVYLYEYFSYIACISLLNLIPSYFIEFYKKYFLCLIIVLINLFINTFIYYNRIVSDYVNYLIFAIVIFFVIIFIFNILFFTNKIIYSTLNRDNRFKEDSLGRAIMEKYGYSLNNKLKEEYNEEDIKSEIDNINDLWKLTEIVKKIRLSRK